MFEIEDYITDELDTAVPETIGVLAVIYSEDTDRVWVEWMPSEKEAANLLNTLSTYNPHHLTMRMVPATDIKVWMLQDELLDAKTKPGATSNWYDLDFAWEAVGEIEDRSRTKSREIWVADNEAPLLIG